MEPGFIALIAIAAIAIGIVVGFIFSKKSANHQYLSDTQYTQGTLTIDCSDSELEPGIFLGLGVPIKDLIVRKCVNLDVNVLHKNRTNNNCYYGT